MKIVIYQARSNEDKAGGKHATTEAETQLRNDAGYAEKNYSPCRMRASGWSTMLITAAPIKKQSKYLSPSGKEKGN